MLKYIIPIIVVMFFVSCKNDAHQVEVNSEIAAAEETYNAQPTKENASSALEIIAKELKANKDDKNKVKDLATKALDIATNSKLTAKQISYLLLLIKDFPNDAKANSRLLELANIMKSINKEAAANVLYSGVVSRFPNTDEAEIAKKNMSTNAVDIKAYMTTIGEDVFANPDKYGVNRKNAQSYVDACEAYALAYPDTQEAPEYLYKGTEVSRTLRTFTKSLTMYDWIIESYPNYEKAPTAMFLKGFIVENELNNDELAKQVYTDFLQKYPTHQLVDDVKFLLQNIGKSDEEIMKIIEANKKEAQ